MKNQLPKIYVPKEVEGSIYEKWEKSGCFRGHRDPDKSSYTIVMPPPNVTGQLHMGHAVDNTQQDILARFKRMQGYSMLWLPGTDHAAIATEAKIVEAMRKEGLTKKDLGKEKFLERAWTWKETYGNRIVKQLRTLGSSCDWEREHFTMDEDCSEAVREVFVRLYDEGLIYRGNRMINWCPQCETSISDAEVEYSEKDGNFWHILYKIKETGEYLELATTRPETLLADTAVAINGEDERYKHLHGCHVILPLVGREIPVICDEHADMEKGTGVVKITPAHDPNDYEVGLRHNLPLIRCFTYDGHMTGQADVQEYQQLVESGRSSEDEPIVMDCGKYAGMTTIEARKAILEDLTANGLLHSTEHIRHDVGECYRCHHTIEPMISKQWFVRMKPLAEPAIKAVEEGEIQFVPERFTKQYLNWMNNTRDWCISRQLWWGHQIPAWYCNDCGEVIVSKTVPRSCPKCSSTNLKQDPDSLDTWFSSALWPFSTLGWPNEDAEDYKYFYPTNTLVTGYDIIGFWVSRMIFSGIKFTGKVPFNKVVIHGIVRDSQGRKMSKSLGNGIDPLEIIDQYGADALRFMLIYGSSPGSDMRFSEEKITAMRNFCNKIWNASRFVQMNLDIDDYTLPENLLVEDRWILTKLNQMILSVTENLDKFEMGIAAQKLYDFIWDELCDWYIEIAKVSLNGSDEQRRNDVQHILLYVLTETLKVLHPFMPFITENIYQGLPNAEGFLMMQSWPEYREKFSFIEDVTYMEKVMHMIRAIRVRRSEMNVPPSKKTLVIICTEDKQAYMMCQDILTKLSSASLVTFFDQDPEDISGMVGIVTPDAKAYIPMAELVDSEKERERIGKELEKARESLEFALKKLNTESFISKAPEKVVNSVKEKKEQSEALIQKLEEALKSL